MARHYQVNFLARKVQAILNKAIVIQFARMDEAYGRYSTKPHPACSNPLFRCHRNTTRATSDAYACESLSTKLSMRVNLCGPKLAPRLPSVSQAEAMDIQSSPRVIVPSKHHPSRSHSSQHSDHHPSLKLEARSPRPIPVLVEICSGEATWRSTLREISHLSATFLVLPSNAFVLATALPHVQSRVLPIKFMIKFGVVVVAVIMPVVSEGGRGQALRATS
jgi:hypothetical protein